MHHPLSFCPNSVWPPSTLYASLLLSLCAPGESEINLPATNSATSTVYAPTSTVLVPEAVITDAIVRGTHNTGVLTLTTQIVDFDFVYTTETVATVTSTVTVTSDAPTSTPSLVHGKAYSVYTDAARIGSVSCLSL